MKLIEIYAEEFGIFEERRFVFGEGLHLIEGDNESGKSTLLALLRFLFYGFPRRSGAGAEECEKRLSRKNRRAAGSVTLSLSGEIYHLRRNYILHGRAGRELPTEEVTLTRRGDGRRVELGGKTPGEYLLGLPQELYDSSLCVRQSEIDGVCRSDTGRALSDHLFAGEQDADLELAARTLQSARRAMQHQRGRGGRIAELEDEYAALTAALEAARRDAEEIRMLRERLSRSTAQLIDRRRERETVEMQLAAAELDRELCRYDAWHAAKKEQSRLLAACEQHTKADPALPDAFFERARALLAQHAAARESLALHAAERERLGALCHAAEPTAQMNALHALGGEGAVREQSDALERGKKRSTVIGAVFALISLASFALCPAFSSLLWLLLISGVASLSLSAVFFIMRQRAVSAIRQLYAALSVDGSSALDACFAACRAEEARIAAREGALAGSCERLSIAEARERALFGELASLFDSIGAGAACQTHEAARQYLDALDEKRRFPGSAASEARARYEQARIAAESLGHGLDPAREEVLRARRATLPTTDKDTEQLSRELSFLKATVEGLTEKTGEYERALAALNALARDPAALLARQSEVGRELSEARERLAAINMAAQALDEAAESLRGDLVPRVARAASEIFCELTAGAHETLCISDDFAVTLATREGSFPLSHFSAGCRDAAHLSLRLALLSVITTEPLPLFLDEVTARLDDARTKNLLSLLLRYTANGRQCLLFTCHTREAALLSGAPAVRITLP